MKGCPEHPEFDAIYVGYSRDGFSWTKPPAGQPLPFAGVGLDASKRGPFMSDDPSQTVGKYPDPASAKWNYGAVQSVTGGVIMPDDKGTRSGTVSSMLTFAGGQSGYGTMGISPGCTVGVASLRRDGWAPMVATDAGGGTVVTRPVTWGADKTQLFLNCEGGVQVEVLSVGGDEPVLRRSMVVGVNSTRVEVQWLLDGAGSLLLPVATVAAPVRLRFTLNEGAKLYSFWPAPDKCGASGGSVAGGGPGFTSSRDDHGSC